MKSATETTKSRYDRLAPFFDSVEYIMERLVLGNLRKLIWQKVSGKNILEAGVGTGKNFPYYPEDCTITAIDFSSGMLARAEQKKRQKKLSVDLQIQDVQALDFPDNSFDTVLATFLFCSVPLPVKGLKELQRVCKPGGQILLLEHVLSDNPILAALMNSLNPLMVRLVGANINRRTVKSVRSIGLSSVHVDSVSTGIVKLIAAKK